MLVHILRQVPYTFAGMIAGTLVMDITKRPLNRIGPGTVGGYIEQLKPPMHRKPLLDFGSFVDLGVVGDDGKVSKERRGVRAIQGVEQIKKEPGLLAIPHTMGDLPGGNV